MTEGRLRERACCGKEADIVHRQDSLKKCMSSGKSLRLTVVDNETCNIKGERMLEKINQVSQPGQLVNNRSEYNSLFEKVLIPLKVLYFIL